MTQPDGIKQSGGGHVETASSDGGAVDGGTEMRQARVVDDSQLVDQMMNDQLFHTGTCET